jgi:hypothetical protein
VHAFILPPRAGLKVAKSGSASLAAGHPAV